MHLEDKVAVKKLTEERDSLKTALKIVTKDLMNFSNDRPISLPISQVMQTGLSEKMFLAARRQRNQNLERREDSMRDSTPGDADKSFTTLLLGDCMIKQMQERRLRRKVGQFMESLCPDLSDIQLENICIEIRKP